MCDVPAKENNKNVVEQWSRKTALECFSSLESTERGLSLIEVVRRLKKYGENSLPEPLTPSLPRIFIRQFQNPLIYILCIASAIVFFLGDIVDTIVIFTVLLLNAIIGVFQEGRAQNTLLALENFTKTEAVALREGVEDVVVDKEVVPGDVIVLREGDKIPADARLFEITNFRVDESALSGESVPVLKTTNPVRGSGDASETSNMVFRGSFVVAGTARALVVATGLETVIGGISRKIITIDTETPLHKSIKILSKYVGIGVLVISVGIFVLGIVNGNSVDSMFFTAVAVAVSLVPEGLPVVITLILSIGAFRMAKQNALVKNLTAVEALGQASVIAVDKTGTITKNELMVERVFIGGRVFTVTGRGYEPKGDILENGVAIDPTNHPEIIFAGKIAIFCASARVMFREKEGVWKVSGDPTEAALLIFGEKIGFRKDELEQEEPQIIDRPFDSSLKYHAVVHSVKKKQFLSVVGSPESILDLSTQYWHAGRSRKMTQEYREEIETMVHRMSREGLRVLAFSIIPNYKEEIENVPIHAATFVGLFAMRDVLREGVRESIETAKESGLRVVMITGDHKVTAETIAREAGIFRDGDLIVTGKELLAFSKQDLKKQLPNISVFARVMPEDKLNIIELFRENVDIIAMTGDGVNDALSLVAADLGIAMGKIGTEVSKAAADIVLLDDNFKSIVLAIEEGRNIYHGIKKVILYLFSTGIGEFLAVVIAMLAFLPPPVFPTQILWLNLITDGFLVAALAFEPKERLGGARVARTGNNFFFDKLVLIRASMMGLTMAVCTVLVFASLIDTDSAKAYTMSLTILAAFQWWNAWNVRSEKEPIWTKIFKNPYLIIATLTVIVLQLFAIYHPVLQKILNTTALSLSELALAVSVSFLIVVVEEVRKFVYRKRNVHKA